MPVKYYLFAISHFCEKARWALDYLQIDYDLIYTAPGLHMVQTKKLGLTSTTLPILDTGTQIIQGSAAIIDWADQSTSSQRCLTPANGREECLAVEQRLDEVAGVHTRRMFYSEALIEHSATVRPVFTKDLSPIQASIVWLAWPMIRHKMIQGMDLGRDQGEESRVILDKELAWLDALLADGRKFLVGDALSRADIAAAGLFGRLASPDEHPSHAFLSLPPRAEHTAQDWRNRPSIQWIRSIYRDYR